MGKQATLRDIAKRAGVAVSTVSQVLNNKPGVSPKMRKRVLQVAEELGYQRKITIPTPLAVKFDTIGLLSQSRADMPPEINPFYSFIISGAEYEIRRHNASMMFAHVEVDEHNRALSLPPMVLDKPLDGIIIVGTFLEETITDISRRAHNNIVLVDAYTSDENVFDSVLIDNWGGTVTAIEYLLDNGHRHIGLIGSEPDAYPSILERREAYFATLRRHGIEDAYVIDGPLDRYEAVEATRQLMTDHPHVTAIFACNDLTAIGALSALREMGLHVPGDVSVVGFDDIDLAAEMVPALTTVRVDKTLMGKMAVRILRDWVEDPDRLPVKIIITTILIERDSVRNLNP